MNCTPVLGLALLMAPAFSLAADAKSGDATAEGTITGFSEVAASRGAASTYYIDKGAGGDRVMMPAGVAAGDVDDDGDVDLFVLQGDGSLALMLLNDGSGNFSSPAAFPAFPASEHPAGASMADVNGDGRLDIVVTLLTYVDAVDFSHVGRGTRLFLNQGGTPVTFVDATDSWNLLHPADAFSASFADINRDGWLDMAVSHWDNAAHAGDQPYGHLWINGGGSGYTDISVSAGIQVKHDTGSGVPIDTTFTPTLADMDGDGLPDLLYAADFCGTQAFRNNGDGTFTEWESNQFDDENGMGSAVGDYDGDGDLDWFVSSIWNPVDDSTNRCTSGGTGIGQGHTGNRLYRNDGNGVFTDVSAAAGVRDGYWGWGSCFADFNNDGWLDLFHVNGSPAPDPDNGGVRHWDHDPARLFINNHDGTFTESSDSLGIADTGQGRGIACFDMEHDGDIDVYITNTFDSVNDTGVGKLYRNNNVSGNNAISVRLRQAVPNRNAIGAVVRVTADGHVQTQHMLAGNNFQSSNPQELHFGIGAATNVEKVEVIWPGCTKGRYAVHDVAAGTQLLLDQREGLPFIGGFEDGNCQ